jgi:hypothetical protein
VLAEAARRLEEGLRNVASEETRRQLEENVKTLRKAEADLRQREEASPTAAASPELVAPAVRSDAPSIEKELEGLERQVQAQWAIRIRPLPEGSRVPREVERGLQQELESQMRALHDQVEAFRLEAEKARAAAEKGILERLGAPASSGRQEPAASALPLPAPPLLPWPYALDSDDPSEGRSGDDVIREVGDSVTGVLEAEGWRLRRLRPEEVVVVAVDFLRSSRRGPLLARPERTLLIRITKKALDDRHSSRIDAEEFRRQAEAVEY